MSMAVSIAAQKKSGLSDHPIFIASDMNSSGGSVGCKGGQTYSK